MSDKQSPDPIRHGIDKSSWMTIALILVTFLFLWSSLGLGRVSAWIPQAILSTTLVLLLLQLAKEFVGRKQAISSTAIPEKVGETSMLPALTWIATMILAVWLSGVTIGVALYCLAYFRWHAGECWQVSVAFALGLGLGVQLSFGTIMQITLYQGILLPNLL